MRIDITLNKDSLFRSFKITALRKYREFLMCPEVWPVGVRVKEYESRSYSRKFKGGGHTYTYGGGSFKQ